VATLYKRKRALRLKMNTLQAMNITVYWKFALRKTRLRLYMPLATIKKQHIN